MSKTFKNFKPTIFTSGELDENSTVREFRTTASDGKAYTQKYYNLQAIIAVGFKVNSQKAIRFRAWAADVLANFAIHAHTAAEIIAARANAEGEYEKYRVIQDHLFSSDFDKFLEETNIDVLKTEINIKDVDFE